MPNLRPRHSARKRCQMRVGAPTPVSPAFATLASGKPPLERLRKTLGGGLSTSTANA
ncbi:hypothetical protein C8Q80DRAFT_1204654 [Daedaleopsis nitida]|nr:hypothetical protein C8Q80DRAFT_1204654 [Daedaleopsis nitida]